MTAFLFSPSAVVKHVHVRFGGLVSPQNGDEKQGLSAPKMVIWRDHFVIAWDLSRTNILVSCKHFMESSWDIDGMWRKSTLPDSATWDIPRGFCGGLFVAGKIIILLADFPAMLNSWRVPDIRKSLPWLLVGSSHVHRFCGLVHSPQLFWSGRLAPTYYPMNKTRVLEATHLRWTWVVHQQVVINEDQLMGILKAQLLDSYPNGWVSAVWGKWSAEHRWVNIGGSTSWKGGSTSW